MPEKSPAFFILREKMKSFMNLEDSKWTELIDRLWKKDVTIWSNDENVKKTIANRLGWLDIHLKFESFKKPIFDFLKKLKEKGVTDAVLLGMGGSSLCPYMWSKIFGHLPKYPTFYVLDTTDPSEIKKIESKLNLDTTLFIVASKSGTTIEPNSLYKYFYNLVSKRSKHPNNHFVAITDEGTPLARLAIDENFLALFINPKDIGGRYSALSFFGLVPATVMGIEVEVMIKNAKIMIEKCKREAKENPAAKLAFFITENLKKGRDKFTFLISEKIFPFALWVEQLLAESTGKDGKGVIPVVGEPLGHPYEYGDDRFFIKISYNNDQTLKSVDNFPIFSINIKEIYELAGEFFRWEMATAMISHFIGINPFDEPNVIESKKNTSMLLERFKKNGKIDETLGEKDDEGFRFVASSNIDLSKDLKIALKSFFSDIKKGDYVGLLAYLPYEEKIETGAIQFREIVRKKKHCATVFGFGPRYLHSTGQQHKGGPPTGRFIILTREEKNMVEIPKEDFSFWHLQFAQAVGDFRALEAKGRKVIHIHLPVNFFQGFELFLEKVKEVLEI